MTKRKLIITLVGIAAGVAVVGGTVGGLAAGGVFETTITHIKEEKKNLLKGKITIYKAFLKYANDKTKLKSAEEIESTTADAIDKEIANLKEKINDDFYKLHLNNVLEKVKNKQTLPTQKLQEIQSTLKEYSDKFKENLFAEFK